jgi:hypothetical protein
MTKASGAGGNDLRALARDTLRSGTLAGLAMIPFAALFRAPGLRINEYRRKTLELFVGDVAPPLHYLLTFAQHIVISWRAAIPLLWILGRIGGRRTCVLVGAFYGAAFYMVVNAWALPRHFKDPNPWELGMETVYPGLAIHLVYGVVLGLTARTPEQFGKRSAMRLAR